jgi:hypothetical protein
MMAHWVHGCTFGTCWLIVGHDGSLGTWLHIEDMVAKRGHGASLGT